LRQKTVQYQAWQFGSLTGLPFATSSLRSSIVFTKESIMIAHRRTWFYRLGGQKFAHSITFKMPVTASKVREALRLMVGATPFEIWGR
jgi:hypothetical protein